MCLMTSWENVDRVREAVSRSVHAVFGDADLRDSVGMVVGELLENAIKYGDPSSPGVRLSVYDVGREIEITVSSALDEGTTHAGQLAERIRWVGTFDNPEDAYLAALAEVYGSGAGSVRSSGLGIARIAYEGRCRIAYEKKEGMVIVRASRPVVIEPVAEQVADQT
jgi:hypothetical protein